MDLLLNRSRLPREIGIVPLSSLKERSTYWSSVNSPSSVGSVPVNVLEERCRNLSFVTSPSSVGSVPVNRFCQRTKYWRFDRTDKSGMSPVNWFPRRSINSSNDSVANSFGSVPVSALSFNERNCRLESVLKSGTVPSRRLSMNTRRERPFKNPSSAGIEPRRWFSSNNGYWKRNNWRDHTMVHASIHSQASTYQEKWFSHSPLENNISQIQFLYQQHPHSNRIQSSTSKNRTGLSTTGRQSQNTITRQCSVRSVWKLILKILLLV
jgi:hypothetical protein